MDPNEPKETNPSTPPSVLEHAERLGESAGHVLEEARAIAESVAAAIDLKGRVDRHPYGMLAAAMGVGYVLGGGLFTPLTRSALRLSIKAAALPLVKDELIALAGAAVDGFIAAAKDRQAQAAAQPPEPAASPEADSPGPKGAQG